MPPDPDALTHLRCHEYLTWCNLTPGRLVNALDPVFFFQEPKAKRCLDCEQAYFKWYNMIMTTPPT